MLKTLVASLGAHRTRDLRPQANAEPNPVVLAQVRTLDAGGGDLKRLDAVLFKWRWTGDLATQPDVMKLVTELLANRPEAEKEAAMRDAVDRLRHEALRNNDAHALMDALRVVRSKHFRR